METIVCRANIRGIQRQVSQSIGSGSDVLNDLLFKGVLFIFYIFM